MKTSKMAFCKTFEYFHTGALTRGTHQVLDFWQSAGVNLKLIHLLSQYLFMNAG